MDHGKFYIKIASERGDNDGGEAGAKDKCVMDYKTRTVVNNEVSGKVEDSKNHSEI